MEILVDIMHGMDYGILAYIAETLRGGKKIERSATLQTGEEK